MQEDIVIPEPKLAGGNEISIPRGKVNPPDSVPVGETIASTPFDKYKVGPDGRIDYDIEAKRRALKQTLIANAHHLSFPNYDALFNKLERLVERGDKVRISDEDIILREAELLFN